MHAGSTRVNHGLHQFEGVQGAAKPRFGVSYDWREPVSGVFAIHVMDLISTHQGTIDIANDGRHAVGGVQALVGIHLARVIGIGGDLPAAEVDGLQSRLDLLHGLVAR